MQTHRTNRRRWMQGTAIGTTAALTSGWAGMIQAAARAAKENDRHCVLLWMSGGPSQLDTFDMKPGHPNGGSIKPAATSVPGIAFSEHLPKLSQHADSLAILRGMSTKEGDHQRGTVLMRTGHPPGGPVNYPSIGSALAKSLGSDEAELPDYVSVAPGPLAGASIRPGFLGPKYAAMSVEGTANPAADFADLQVEHLRLGQDSDQEQHLDRLALWKSMQQEFLATRNVPNAVTHDTVYRSAHRILNSDGRQAFDLSGEPDRIRESYGRSVFGQGCLLARRLIEQGVPLVEVALGDGLGWDTHADNFERVKRLCEQLDAGWATLMSDLAERGLLDKTTILWAGEFGRTPAINRNGGRDHFPQAFSVVLAGAGIAGGQVFGATSADGTEVIDGKLDQQDLLATLCLALGVDPATENIAEGGRPIAIAEGTPVSAVLG